MRPESKSNDCRNARKNSASRPALSLRAIKLPNGAALVVIQTSIRPLICITMFIDKPMRPASAGPLNMKMAGVNS